jgi:predicted RNase H-like HicB family nuclease/predicted RNA binding protein YcfA (HicA-like mRNA interferase family)
MGRVKTLRLRSPARLRGRPHRFLRPGVPVKVNEAIRRAEGAGWALARTRGSHRQYRHPDRPGLVTIRRQTVRYAGSEDWGEHRQASRDFRTRPMIERRYLIVIEGADDANYSAYAPDLPGCVATGATLEECEREMQEAIAFHIEGLRGSGQPVPESSRVTATYVEIAA